MSNNPMKRPVIKRKLGQLKVPFFTPWGTTGSRKMRKGDINWRALAGQRVNKLA